MRRARRSPAIGAVRKGRVFAYIGDDSSLENSFRASARG